MTSVTLEVVIPAMNVAHSIRGAVDSAFRSGATRVIVVDDGSTDDTAAIAASAGAQVVSQPNSGPTAARLRGLESVESTVVSFLDADDELCPDGVSEGCQLMDNDTRIVGVIGRYRYSVDGTAKSVAALGHRGLSAQELIEQGHGPAPPSAILYRTMPTREAVSTSAGPWSGATYADDYELLIRVARYGTVVSSERVACIYAFGSGRSFSQRQLELQGRRLVQQHYANQYGFPIAAWSHRRDRATELLGAARLANLRGQRSRFVSYLVRAVAQDPLLLARALHRRTFARCGRRDT